MPDRFRASLWTAPLALLIERYPLARERPLVGLAAAVVGTGLGWSLRVAADPLLGNGFPYITFFPAVVLVAFFFGIRAGIVSAVLGGIVSWYAFIEPRNSFALPTGAMVALAFYLLVVGIDLLLIFWAQVAAERLRDEKQRYTLLASQRKLMFDELQHRVGNNLQVIGALISAQRRQVQDEAARDALEEASNRVTVIGRITRQLYQADGAAVSADGLLKQLGRDVLDAHGRVDDIAIRYAVDDSIELPREAIIPLALTFTEAMANVTEHAIPEGKGAVDVELRRTGPASALLQIVDHGRGLPAGFALDQTSSLGLRIASQLSRQLGGEFTLRPHETGGTVAQLTLKI